MVIFRDSYKIPKNAQSCEKIRNITSYFQIFHKKPLLAGKFQESYCECPKSNRIHSNSIINYVAVSLFRGYNMYIKAYGFMYINTRGDYNADSQTDRDKEQHKTIF